MIRRILGVLAVSLAMLAFVGGAGSPASAAARTVTVHMSTEAWYSEPPPCVSLIDCSAAPSAAAYPRDTLHVESSAGQETARTYLAFQVPVPSGGRMVGGTLRLPLDTSSSDGSVTPDQAHVTACLVTQPVTPVRGSLAKPPPADCKVSSEAVYDAKHAAFTVDLAPFASAWQTGSAGLALVPSQAATQANETWHVVFYATTKDTKTAPPVTAAVTYTAPSQKPSHPNSAPPPSGAGSGGGGTSPGSGSSAGGSTFTGGGGLGTFPTTPSTTTQTTTTVTQVQGQPPTTSVPVAIAGFAGPGFAYPMAWALPLAVLAGFGAIGRVLTKELYRRGV